MKTVIVTPRPSDYHACLEEHPEHWACGKTADAAVGSLMRSHGKFFEVDVVVNWMTSAHPDGINHHIHPDETRGVR